MNFIYLICVAKIFTLDGYHFSHYFLNSWKNLDFYVNEYTHL